MKYTVREATVEDAADICNLLIRSIRENCHEDHHGDEAILAGWLEGKTPENMARWIVSDEAETIVCDKGGAIIGLGSVGANGTIHLCYVDPEHKRCGVGTHLLNTMMHRAQDMGNNIVNLVSTATAKTFYEANGFVYSGATMPCHGIPGYPMAQVVDDFFSK